MHHFSKNGNRQVDNSDVYLFPWASGTGSVKPSPSEAKGVETQFGLGMVQVPHLVDDYFAKFVCCASDFYLQTSSGRYLDQHQPLSWSHIEQHLSGTITVGLRSITSDGLCKWVCFDEDSILPEGEAGFLDGLSVTLNQQGVHSIREGVRPAVNKVTGEAGTKQGHLWILFDSLIPARLARIWAHALLPQGKKPKELNIEIFPKQDVPATTGNCVKAPLARHAKLNGERVWFEAPPKTIKDQLIWLGQQPLNDGTKICQLAEKLDQLNQARNRFASLSTPKPVIHKGIGLLELMREVGIGMHQTGEWFVTRCPSCALRGGDTGHSHLRMKESGALMCFAGCAPADIRRAFLGGSRPEPHQLRKNT